VFLISCSKVRTLQLGIESFRPLSVRSGLSIKRDYNLLETRAVLFALHFLKTLQLPQALQPSNEKYYNAVVTEKTGRR